MVKRYSILLIIGFIFMALMMLWIRTNNLSQEGIALRILSKWKSLTGQKTDFHPLSVSGPAPSHDVWEGLLHSFVSESGEVDYLGFIDQKEILADYLNILSSHPPSVKWSKEESLAYWINAYNAYTIELIIEYWPVQSIKDIGGNIPMVNSPWDIKFFKIDNIEFDLNTIEHEILRKQFRDPRIHFAINCASKSCPSLRNEAFLASKIDRQLDEQSINFLNDPGKNSLSEKSLILSPIFKWFSEDFGNKKQLVKFIQSVSNVKFGTSVQISYQDYDWSLNQVLLTN